MNYFEEQHRASLSSYILENNLEAIPDQTTEIAAAQLGEAAPGLGSWVGYRFFFFISFTKFQIPDSRGGVFVLSATSIKGCTGRTPQIIVVSKQQNTIYFSTRQTTVKQQTATRAARKVLRDALNYR